MGKKVFFSKVGLSYFFYVEAIVRISYMGTFVEAMVLKLCTGYLDHITEYVCENFFRFRPLGPKLRGKEFFSKVDSVSE